MYNFFKDRFNHEFDETQKLIMDGITANAAIWGIDPATLSNLQHAQLIWKDAYDKFQQTPNRSISIAYAKNHAMYAYHKLLVQVLRKSIIGNPVVTGQQMVDMGLPDDGKYPSQSVSFRKDLDLEAKVSSENGKKILLKMKYNSLSSRANLPDKRYRVHVKYAEMGQPLDEGNGYDYLSSSAFVKLEVNQALKGKAINIIARWIGPKGEQGNFSAPESVFVKA